MKNFAFIAAALLLTGVSSHTYAAGNIDAGKEKSALCVACHGADGNSTDPQYPRLAGQHASYLERALEDYRSGTRKNPIMAGFAGGLTDEDIANLAAYFSRQTGLVTSTQPNTISN